MLSDFFFFNDTATTEIYTLSLHDALPISGDGQEVGEVTELHVAPIIASSYYSEKNCVLGTSTPSHETMVRSEEHTSELQSRQYLVCRLLLEKKKNTYM